MKKYLPGKFALPIILFFAFMGIARASHIAGAEITYQHLSGNQYRVNLNLFVDCLGFDPGAAQTINFESTCGSTSSLIVNCTNPGGTEISQICPSQIGSSTCNGGSLPGMWIFKYSGTITLSPTCDTWKMSWTVCCRNNSTVNLVSASSVGTYVEADLNSATDSTNSSPYFTRETIPYVCLGQPVTYNSGIIDPEGDSLNFSLISAEDAGGTPLTYAAGYSATSPISGIAIDQLTGALSFTPSTLGTFVVVVKVQEFNSNGDLIGSVMRDLQFLVMNCSNTIPSASSGTISNLSGAAVQTGPHSIQMCSGNSFAFDLSFTDPNASDILNYQSTLNSIIPGAVVSASGSNPLNLHVSCGPGLVNASTSFAIDVTDNACPYYGIQSYAYTIQTDAGTVASPDITICGSQSAALNVNGGSMFNWSVISGPPMVIGTNFSCNSCSNPIASPVATTTYEVVSNIAGGCPNRDTVTVSVTSPFSFNAIVSTSAPCVSNPRQLNISALSPSGPGYTYSWSPTAYLDNPAIQNPIATINAPGNYIYTATVTSSSGCVMQDTVNIYVSTSSIPLPVINTAETSVCPGTVIQLNGGSVSAPAICGSSATACASTTAVTIGSGAGSNSTTSYPAPYGNWYTSVKQQYLYTATELNAAGIMAGKIDQLDFNVTSINGISTYQNYSISMGCTPLSTFSSTPSAFESGLINVFPSQTYPVTVGWNPHVFSTSYLWDGFSNIIVEVCMSQLSPGANYTNNCVSQNDSTSYISTLYSLSDATDQCSSTPSLLQTSTVHPMIRFHHCNEGGDTTNYVYSWSPASAVTSPLTQVTNATVNAAITFSLTVTDTITGCSSTTDQAIGLGGPNMTIKGIANYAGSPVSGFAKLFKYMSGVQMPLQDSVVISGGNYSFSGVSPGNYIVQATPDTVLFPLVVPTYYDLVYSWDSANVVTLAPICYDTIIANITMLSHPSMVGTNVISGSVIEGPGYLHTPGFALQGINVFLKNSSSGVVVDHTVTNTSGNYYFDNVASDCYNIYVDIPGLNMLSSYSECVSGNDVISGLNFVADSNAIYTSNAILALSAQTKGSPGLKVYPNPTAGKFIVECYLPEQDYISLEMINAVGETVSVILKNKKPEGVFKAELGENAGFDPGLYFIKLVTSKGITIQKLVITR